MILKKDGSFIKKFSIVICLSLVLNCIFVPRVYAADAATYRTGLAPLETLVAAVVIGSGIVAGQSQQAVNALVNSVSKIIKDNTVRKQEEDPAFQSSYRVIQGGGGSGSDPTPEEPNNNNKNGRWFGVVGASALGSSLLFEKGAVEEIMRTIQSQNGYNSTASDIGIVSADDFKTQSTSGQIALQLANLGAPALGQFNAFLNSSYWDTAPFDKNNCWFAVVTNVPDILNNIYPEMRVTVMQKSDDVSFIRLKNRLSYYTYSNNNGSMSFYGLTPLTSDSANPNFLNQYEVNVPVRQQSILINSRNSSDALRFTKYTVQNSSNIDLKSIHNDLTQEAYCGYKWVHKNDWGFTNNVYNSNQTFNVNFPDWLQQSISLLGKQIDAVNLGLQNLSKINWATTQPQIQTAAASDAAVSQAINNWENPGNIPEPEPNPNPDPDPDPEPQPVPEPVPDNEYLGNFLLPESITTKFPFCIPFDVARCLRLFSTSAREAPRWECDLGYGSSSYHVVIDLSVFNDVADFIRPLEYILFLVGLAVGTRALIRG